LFTILAKTHSSHGQFRFEVVKALLICFLVFSSQGVAADFLALDGEDSARVPWRLKADLLSYDKANDLYTASGNVRITRGASSITADTVRVDVPANTVDASGQVVMTIGNDVVRGNRIVVNSREQTGVIYDGRIFFSESHFHITGNRIVKTGEQTYFIDDYSVTACDGESPDWKITGKDLDITVEGYGTCKHAAFYTKSLPLLYVPYLVFPVKVKRQTGLLLPNFAYSERDGFEYNLPFFWAINESSDATYYQNYMDRRGMKHGLEYRYILSRESKGAVMCDYLYDRRIDDGGEFEGYRGDNELRLNRKRWWFRMKNNQDLTGGFMAKMDVDVVSDQDYLREFTEGYSGFELTDEYFRKEYARDIDDYTDTIRTNQLTVDKNWSQYSLNGAILWYDDVIVRNNNSSEDTTLQQLPSVTFTALMQQIGQTPFLFDLASFYKHSWRRSGTRGHSAELYPRVYCPVRLGRFDFEPSAGLRETAWLAERCQEQEDKHGFRGLYDLKGDLSTELVRIFRIKGDRVDKIKHSITPRIFYSYIPDLDQEDIPSFVERAPGENLLTYSIINYFTAKQKQRPSPDPESPSDRYQYHDFCRLELSQSYDIAEARRKRVDDQYERRPFSDLKAALEINPCRNVSLDYDTSWDPYDGECKNHNTSLSLSDLRGDRLSVEHRYARGTSETILAETSLNIYKGLWLNIQHEHDLYDHQDIMSAIGCSFTTQCWSLFLTYKDEKGGEKKFTYMIKLSGFN
jgi:LPS-assembly protein